MLVSFLKNSDLRPNDITHAEYVDFHFKGYLQGLYVLKSRVKKFIKRVEREYKKSSEISRISAWRDEFLGVLNGLKPQLDLRSKHVHEKDYIDTDIALIATGDVLSQAAENGYVSLPEDFPKTLEKLCDDFAKSRSKVISELLSTLTTLVDKMYYELIYILGTTEQKLMGPTQPVR